MASIMVTFKTGVHIDRPIDAVFDFVSDPTKFSEWNSAVKAVRPIGRAQDELGATYVMERDLPWGSAENHLEVVAFDRPREFAVRTTSGPTPLLYRYHFSGDRNTTDVVIDARVELAGIATLAGPFAAPAVKRGVEENLRSLRDRLEG